MVKKKERYGLSIAESVFWALASDEEHYRSTHTDLMDHPVRDMPPGRQMLYTICDIMLEWHRILKQSDLKGINWSLFTVIPLLPSPDTNDLIMWHEDLLDKVGEHGTPPEIGSMDCDFVSSLAIGSSAGVETYTRTLGPILPQYPKIHFKYSAVKSQEERDENEPFYYRLYLVFDEYIT